MSGETVVEYAIAVPRIGGEFAIIALHGTLEAAESDLANSKMWLPDSFIMTRTKTVTPWATVETEEVF